MNEIVFIPIPPLAPKISSSEISTYAKSKCINFNFREIHSGQNYNNLKLQNFNGIHIKKCKNVDDALQMFKLQSLVVNFNQFDETFMIKIESEGSLDALDAATILKLMKKLKKKFSIILFQTFSEKCQIYWKYDEKLFWLKMDPQVSNFVLNFLAFSLSNDHLGICNDFLTIFSLKNQILELDLLSLIDLRGYNLLMLAAEEGEASVVDSLIQHGFDVNVLINDDTAIDLAYDNHHFDIVLTLLHANSLYPKNFNNSQLTDEIKNFIIISRELHNSIRQRKKNEVETILNENPNLRHFYNTKNLSAASQAVICGALEIYELLLSKSVYIGPKEDFNAMLRKINVESCENMRGIHLEYIQSSSDKHLMILTVNSFVGHDIPDVDEKLKHISKAFKYLNEIDSLISLILKVVAASRDFKIIFDFHRQSIQHLDPTSSQFTRGVYHTSRHIYIAAQQMLDPNTVHEIYGTMAHELCHYALHLVYHNDCKPYFDDELDIIKNFTKIALFCKMRQEKEILIGCVFNNYPKELQHAELIVRIPHMIAEYSNNPKKLQEKRQIFPELFQFAENITAVDMEYSLTAIEFEAENEIKKFEHRLKKEERENFWLWIFSIFCILSLPLMVYITLWMSETSKPLYSCANLTDQKYKIMESTVNFQGVPVFFKDLFGNDTNSCEDLTTQEIGKMLEVYDSNQFINAGVNVYKDANDNNIFQNDRELDDGSDILYKYIDTNFRQTSFNVSSKVELKTPFYIGRRVYQKLRNGRERNIFSFNELKKDKLVAFSDSAGNGKSTTFRRAAWKLKRTLPLFWISYVDLKDHIEALKVNDFKSMKKSEISDFISDKILKITSKVERKIFSRRFNTNNAIILWDAVDEISPICTENILELIKKISKLTENKQWISTRVHLENKIITTFNVNVYGIRYYNEFERTSFIQKFLEVNNVTNQTAKIIKKNIISTILSLESPRIFENLEKKEINTPLMIRMICDRELYKFLKENDKNMSDSSSKPENIYTFYEHFIDVHIGITNNTKGLVVSNDVMAVKGGVGSINEIHQFYALKEIFGLTELRDVITRNIINFKDLGIMQNTHYLTNEKLVRFGILYENSAGLLKFEHRTFAEFLVAQYFFDNLWDPYIDFIDPLELKWRLQLLLSIIKNNEQFKVVLDFVIGFLEVKQSRSQNSFGNKLRKIMNDDYGQLFHYFDYNPKSINIATKFFKKDREIIRKLWKIDENFSFFQETFDTLIEIDYYYEMRKVVGNNFDESDQRRILNGINQQMYILFRIWKNQYNYTDYNETIPNIESIYEKLTHIQAFKNAEFLEFMDALNYSKSEFCEFLQQTLIETIHEYAAHDLVDFTKYWKFIDKKLDYKDIKLVLHHKQLINDQTILFQILHLKSNFAQIILNFIESHLTNNEILNLMLQREQNENASFLSHDIDLIHDSETLNLTWQFVLNHTQSQQTQILTLFDKPSQTFKTVWTLLNADVFQIYSQIFMNLYTKSQLCSMITELIENMEIFAINSEEHDKDDSLVTTKRRSFLDNVCEGDVKKLGNIYSSIINMYIR
ncbi:uncharacterized protein [Chironomus tepperi]|uniref:uncharacterized protein n=1 Tax=Chironomus tepperi TaxID=113505 RepID=UPI00391F9632